jgi:hypothetical protein
VDGADQVAPVVLIHVALTVRPPPANVGLGLKSKKIIIGKKLNKFLTYKWNIQLFFMSGRSGGL